MSDTINLVKKLRRKIEECNAAYYINDEPVVSDEVYDLLAECHDELTCYMNDTKTDYMSYNVSKKAQYSRNKGTRLREFVSDYVLFDLETTSKYINSAEVIEIAAIKVKNDEKIDEFYALVKPNKPIPHEIIELTGITNEMVSESPSISEVLPYFLRFIDNEILVGHNINSYDLNIIYDLAEDLLNKTVSNDFVDTYDLSRCLVDLDLPRYNLDTLCKHFNVTNEEAHRALSDVMANHEVYQKMKKYEIGYYKFPVAKVMSYKNFKCAVDVVNKRICLTGEFKCASRNDIKEHLIEMGARVTNYISKKTDYLLVGDLGTSTTHKLDEAAAANIAIIYEKDFIILE